MINSSIFSLISSYQPDDYNLLFEQINMGFFIKLIKNVIYLIMKNKKSDSIVFFKKRTNENNCSALNTF